MMGADVRCQRWEHLALGGLGERGCTAVPWDPYPQTACSNVNTPTSSHEDLLPGHRGKELEGAQGHRHCVSIEPAPETEADCGQSFLE